MNPQFYTKQKVDGLLSTKLDSDGTAADSTKLGGVGAGEYARKTDVPKRVSNDTDTVRIDGDGNVYDVTNTPTDNYITVTYNTGLVRRYDYNKIDASGNYEFKFTGGNDYIQYKQDTGYVSLNYSRVAVANKVDPLNDEQIVVSSISATNITSIVHTPQKSSKTEEKTDRLARESQLAGYALKTDVPARVRNDADTERIDGSGNVYALDVPKSMYFIVDRGWGGGTDLQEWTLYSSSNGVWKWSNNGAYSSNSYYITYDASAGTLSAYYESGGYSRTITVEKNLDPTAEGVDFGGLGGLTVAQYSCSYVPKTNQRSEPLEPTDRLARESQLAEYALKTDVPNRVRNDTDTVRIDGDGNVYEAEFIEGGYYVATTSTGSTVKYSFYQKSGAEFLYRGPLVIRYNSVSGKIYYNDYVTVTTAAGIDPQAGGVLPDFDYIGTSFKFYKQASEFPSEPTAQLLRGTVDGKFTDAQKEELAETFAKKDDTFYMSTTSSVVPTTNPSYWFGKAFELRSNRVESIELKSSYATFSPDVFVFVLKDYVSYSVDGDDELRVFDCVLNLHVPESTDEDAPQSVSISVFDSYADQSMQLAFFSGSLRFEDMEHGNNYVVSLSSCVTDPRWPTVHKLGVNIQKVEE